MYIQRKNVTNHKYNMLTLLHIIHTLGIKIDGNSVGVPMKKSNTAKQSCLHTTNENKQFEQIFGTCISMLLLCFSDKNFVKPLQPQMACWTIHHLHGFLIFVVI